MDRVLASAAERAAAGLPDPEQGPWPRRGRRALLALAPLLLIAALPASRTGIRPLAFLLDPRDPAHYAERASLALAPGDIEVLAGSPLRLELREVGLPWRFPGDLRLEIDETGDLFQPAPLVRDGETWVHTHEAVQQGFRYRARHGRSVSESYRVSVYHPPLLDSLRITATPPAYTKLPARSLDLQSGSLGLPLGSRLVLEGLAASPLARAWLLGAGPDSLPLAVDGRHLRGALSVDGDARLALRLEDTRGTVSRTPTLIELSALPDRPPTVEILAPGPDADLSRDLLQALEISAADDYGVANLTLRAVKREDPDSLRRALPLGEAAGQPRAALRWRWDLGADWALFPGDVVEYWLEVTDTRPGLPGRGVSAIQRLRVPSVAEIYADIEKEDETRTESLEEMVDEGQRLQEEMRRLEEELRADPELDWEREQELKDTFARLEQMSEQLEELQQGLAERSDKLGENEMLRQQMAEKLQKIEELMAELRDTEAGELLRRFQEMLEQMDPERLPEELEQMRLDHAEILEQLERTEAMLEQLMRDQEMDALQRQLDELLEQQEKLRAESEQLPEQQPQAEAPDAEPQDQEPKEAKAAADSSASAPSEPKPETGGEETPEQKAEREALAEKQQKLAAETAELLKKIQEAAKELQEEFPEQAEAMEKAAEPQTPEDPSGPMEDAGEQLGDKSPEANQSQREAARRLLKLYWKLVKAQAGMSAQTNSMALAAIENATREALEVSLREEAHEDETARLLRQGQRPERLREAARRQMGLYQSMEQVREGLTEAAKLTFGVSRDALRHSQEALEAMANSVGELEAGQGAAGVQSAGRSVGHLNVAVVELLRGTRMQGSGTGSCPNPGSAMQDMLQRQEQLNEESRGQAGRAGGGLSMEERAGMARLRAEQRAIREGVEDLMGGDEGEVLGRLDKVVEDMQEVERDIEAGRLDAETLRRQEKIFERLLDAQRSVQRRDFKQERQSESADELAPLWPDDLRGDDPLAKLRDEIRRGLGEAAPPEYEELIQEYYRSLLERQDAGTPLP
jgi:regulator of replication initiation timing